MKPGYTTTEFFLTVLSLLLSALMSFGVLTNDEANQWYDLVAPVVTATVPLVIYIWTRAKLKVAAIEAHQKS
jgi:hypothetical protein